MGMTSRAQLEKLVLERRNENFAKCRKADGMSADIVRLMCLIAR